MDKNEHTGFLPITEERASVSKERHVSGRVRVSTRTETVESRLPVDLTETEVDVVRVPVDRRIDAAPEVVTQGDLTIIPVVEERLVVTRELYLREEIHVRRVERRETAEVPVTTRRQTAIVERLPPEGDAPSTPRHSQKDSTDDL
ncbi:YsnF/AvaK domain-containing protein [Falsirhodobacter deserti]|uniref:YsnF/AvaK domain-containing protein n=1 Tax=Falsirhodobacter deserti TaxID=1365611 RepID=UPI000FE3EBED|nr:YsnF/AvaK domain-containing protein [Falsirhodobacter deserti]